MENGDSELLKAFRISVFDNLIDFSQDLIELPIDRIIDNSTLKEIPIVGTLIGIGKTTMAIRDMHLLKKTVAFISKINEGSIPKEKLDEHIEKLEKNHKRMNQELEYLIIMLDHFNETKKAFILGNIYIKYIDHEIDWNDFCILAEILERFSLYDFSSLIELYTKDIIKHGEVYNELALSRIYSLGLVRFSSGIILYSERQEFVAKINSLGKLFVDMAFLDKEGKIIH